MPIERFVIKPSFGRTGDVIQIGWTVSNSDALPKFYRVWIYIDTSQRSSLLSQTKTLYDKTFFVLPDKTIEDIITYRIDLRMGVYPVKMQIFARTLPFLPAKIEDTQVRRLYVLPSRTMDRVMTGVGGRIL